MNHPKTKGIVTFYSQDNNIKEKKIDYAKMLLRTTNLSVSEIAQRLGYINLSHFTASFKQITNTTPVNYRKKY